MRPVLQRQGEPGTPQFDKQALFQYNGSIIWTEYLHCCMEKTNDINHIL